MSYLVSPVREPDDEQWGPDWSELLMLEPASSNIILNNESIDSLQ